MPAPAVCELIAFLLRLFAQFSFAQRLTIARARVSTQTRRRHTRTLQINCVRYRRIIVYALSTGSRALFQFTLHFAVVIARRRRSQRRRGQDNRLHCEIFARDMQNARKGRINVERRRRRRLNVAVIECAIIIFTVLGRYYRVYL